ncbi:hypothetical protein PLANPX_2685 [Lacipirellula parvula]|uniref:Uncharacterized protein n=1 Tax=Lacipirellula parvula TaxID=2650471 RepID=A0A5K7XFQ9_9BACT|nr:hypothetical protein PLANPX_2685 [Lacipirellula parvula]
MISLPAQKNRSTLAVMGAQAGILAARNADSRRFPAEIDPLLRKQSPRIEPYACAWQ